MKLKILVKPTSEFQDSTASFWKKMGKCLNLESKQSVKLSIRILFKTQNVIRTKITRTTRLMMKSKKSDLHIVFMSNLKNKYHELYNFKSILPKADPFSIFLLLTRHSKCSTLPIHQFRCLSNRLGKLPHSEILRFHDLAFCRSKNFRRKTPIFARFLSATDFCNHSIDFLKISSSFISRDLLPSLQSYIVCQFHEIDHVSMTLHKSKCWIIFLMMRYLF